MHSQALSLAIIPWLTSQVLVLAKSSDQNQVLLESDHV